METNNMNPNQTALKSSLIRVHIMCNIGYQSTLAAEKCPELQGKVKHIFKQILVVWINQIMMW